MLRVVNQLYSRSVGQIRLLSTADDVFAEAQKKLKTLSEEPDVDTKLKLYALFKQSTSGDVKGSRPGMMDFAGRAKFDAWSKLNGTSQDQAKTKYAELVTSLKGQEPEKPTSSGISGLEPVNGLDFSIEGKVFKITLSRPTKFNALTIDMYEGIIKGLKASSENDSTSITVISGAGNFFCSGNDLSNFAKAATASKEEIREMALTAGKVLERYVQAYIDHDKPLVGLINGPAVGIAVTVLPLFDYVLATDKSFFHTPFNTLGQSPEGCSSYTFPLLMGQLRASDVLTFGRKLTPQVAQDYGLVSQVVPDAEFAKRAQELVTSFSSLPPESLKVNKCLLRNIHKEALTKTNVMECRTIEERWQSKECAQAIAAFLTRSKK